MFVLAIDCGSAVASVAVGDERNAAAVRSFAAAEAAEAVMPAIEQSLRDAGRAVGEISGIVALRGPGSFNGLRIGLATALGLHHGLGCAALGIDSLQVLASAAPRERGAPYRALAAIPAPRGFWYVQPFDLPPDARCPLAAAPAVRWPSDRLLARAEHERVVVQAAPVGLRASEVGALAPAALCLLPALPLPWAAATLAAPTYLHGALVTIDGRSEEHG